jgi:hypothetical protein
MDNRWALSITHWPPSISHYALQTRLTKQKGCHAASRHDTLESAAQQVDYCIGLFSNSPGLASLGRNSIVSMPGSLGLASGVGHRLAGQLLEYGQPGFGSWLAGFSLQSGAVP